MERDGKTLEEIRSKCFTNSRNICRNLLVGIKKTNTTIKGTVQSSQIFSNERARIFLYFFGFYSMLLYET